MSNNRRFSFFQLFTKGNDYRLVIPIIQRDYAQGRDNDKAREVRNDFLKELFTYMSATDGCHDLDFVYGMSAPSTDISRKKEFVPLDGQQRLTTLFLIHLYLAIRTMDSDVSKKFFNTMQVKSGQLRKCLFSYRTRSSAVEFCDCLIDDRTDYSEVFEKDQKGNRIYKNTLSGFILNTSWFYPDWLQDTTVSGMLRMLDAIDMKFDNCDHQHILSRLLSADNPSVAFIFMDLEDYRLTDDLYIKMNSRGKPLTAFENFKAKYEQYIGRQEKIKKSEALCDLAKEIAERNDKVIKTVKENFAFNIDTSWSQLFWKYSEGEIRNREREIANKSSEAGRGGSLEKLLSETLDRKISNFIRMALINQYAIEQKQVVPREMVENETLSFTKLDDMKAISADGVVLTTRMFELFSSRPLAIMPQWAHCYYDEKSVFVSMINNQDFSFTKRLLLYACIMFRSRIGDKPEELAEWMRFWFNMTLDDNSIQDITRNTYYRAISSLNTMLELLVKDNASVETLLASGAAPQKLEFFPEYQYREEILKSHLIKRDDEKLLHNNRETIVNLPLDITDSWGAIILKLEAHPYFTGQIGFILKMAGIADYYAEHHDLEWDDSEDLQFKEAIISYGRIASGIFEGGYTDRKLASSALFERAMLVAHPQYMDSNFLNSTNKTAGSNNLMRDVSWKSRLRLSDNNEKILAVVQNLFDSLDVDNLEKSLKSIIDNDASELLWRRDIARYDYLMNKSRNGFTAKADSGHRILKNSINFSMGDHEVYSYVLYWEYLSNKGTDNVIDGFKLSYTNSNSNQEVPFIKLAKDDCVIKIKSDVTKEDGQLIRHYLQLDSDGNSELELFLIQQGFSKRGGTDTIFRCNIEDWMPTSPADEYRKRVDANIKKFISNLSDFLNTYQKSELE